jgi:hypothetical protein
MDDVFKELDIVSGEVEDRDERRKILRGTGNLVCDGHESITLEVVRQFPDLHRDKPRRDGLGIPVCLQRLPGPASAGEILWHRFPPHNHFFHRKK